MGSDADLPDSPSCMWKGPACQLLYLFDGKKIGWQKEVRTDFPDAQKAAEEAKAEDPGAYAMEELGERFRAYDFSALIAAEWRPGGPTPEVFGRSGDDTEAKSQNRRFAWVPVLDQVRATLA